MELIKFTGDGADNFDADYLHLPAATGIDYTLCGVTLDGDDRTAGSFLTVKAPAVTCPECIEIIRHCRGVRVDPNPRPCGSGNQKVAQ